MPFFKRSGHLVVTVDQFLQFVDPSLPQEHILELRDRTFLEVAKPRILRLVVWMGGPGMRLRLCPLLGSRAGYYFSKWLNNWSGVTAVAGLNPPNGAPLFKGSRPLGWEKALATAATT